MTEPDESARLLAAGLEARAVRRGLGGARRRCAAPATAAARVGRRRPHGCCDGPRSACWPSRGVGGGAGRRTSAAGRPRRRHGGQPDRIGRLGELPVRAAAGRRAAPGRAAGPTGKIVTVDHLLRRGQREQLRRPRARSRSTWSRRRCCEAAAGRPAVVLRAISDTPGRPLLSPRAVPGGIAALRSLRLAAPALARWAAACGPRRVLLAGPRSFCAGVERAIEIVERVLDQHGPPVYVRKQIVHNKVVVTDLEGRGRDLRGRARRGARRRDRGVLRARGVAGGARARPPAAACRPSTRPARWWPRCTPRRAGSPPRATRWRSSGTPGTRRSRAPSARRRGP